MFISGIKLQNNSKKLGKTIAVYLLMTVLAIAVNLIYGLFGHGVHSAAMTGMFLYPLLGGALGYLLIDRYMVFITRFVVYRIGYNSFNSGLAALTVGSFLKGILEIAGTNSPYLIIFFFLGWVAVGIGLVVFGFLVVSNQRFLKAGKRMKKTEETFIHE
ncbi:hypothetical protein [Acetobacterium wieringae]|uniref:hypothetical protein n=1 Tax=Acetobacterium wieringae TaxID=52694 RepID=UPI0026F31249|nr:hypothetical protein [Acetobacterium wieringae]